MLISNAVYQLDLPNKTIIMIIIINTEEEVEDVVEDVRRSLLPQKLYQRKGREKEVVKYK